MRNDPACKRLSLTSLDVYKTWRQAFSKLRNLLASISWPGSAEQVITSRTWQNINSCNLHRQTEVCLRKQHICQTLEGYTLRPENWTFSRDFRFRRKSPYLQVARKGNTEVFYPSLLGWYMAWSPGFIWVSSLCDGLILGCVRTR